MSIVLERIARACSVCIEALHRRHWPQLLFVTGLDDAVVDA